jgi:chromosome segregation ATPase
MEQEIRDEFERARREQKEKFDDIKDIMEQGNERIEKALSLTNAALAGHIQAFSDHTLQLARENERLKMATEAAHRRLDEQKEKINPELERLASAPATELREHKEKEFAPVAQALDKHLSAHRTWAKIFMAAALALAALIVKAAWEFITTGRITPKGP